MKLMTQHVMLKLADLLYAVYSSVKKLKKLIWQTNQSKLLCYSYACYSLTNSMDAL